MVIYYLRSVQVSHRENFFLAQVLDSCYKPKCVRCKFNRFPPR